MGCIGSRYCRRGAELLERDLPAKLDAVILMRQTPLQQELYGKYLDVLDNERAAAEEEAYMSGGLKAPPRQLFRDVALLNELLNMPQRFESDMKRVLASKEGQQVEIAGKSTRFSLPSCRPLSGSPLMPAVTRFQADQVCPVPVRICAICCQSTGRTSACNPELTDTLQDQG